MCKNAIRFDETIRRWRGRWRNGMNARWHDVIGAEQDVCAKVVAGPTARIVAAARGGSNHDEIRRRHAPGTPWRADQIE